MARLSDTHISDRTPFIKADDLAAETSPFQIIGATIRDGMNGEKQAALKVRLWNESEHILTVKLTEQRQRYVDWFLENPREPIENLALKARMTKNGQKFWDIVDIDGAGSDIDF
jgi:hypothetical protein